MKKLLAVLLAMLVLSGVFAVGASADGGVTKGHIRYSKEMESIFGSFNDEENLMAAYWFQYYFDKIDKGQYGADIDSTRPSFAYLEPIMKDVYSQYGFAQEFNSYLNSLTMGLRSRPLQLTKIVYYTDENGIVNTFAGTFDIWEEYDYFTRKWLDNLKVYIVDYSKEFFLTVAEAYKNGVNIETAYYEYFSTICVPYLDLSVEGFIKRYCPATYTVTYDLQGGTGAFAQQTFTETKAQQGAIVTLYNKEPTKTEYSFKGWATASAAAEVVYKKGESFLTGKNVTLYAVWRENKKSDPTPGDEPWYEALPPVIGPIVRFIARFIFLGFLWMR